MACISQSRTSEIHFVESKEQAFACSLFFYLQPSGLAQGIGLVGLFPRELDIVASEVTVGSRLAINRAAQVQVTDDRAGRRSKFSSTSLAIFSSAILPVPKVSTLMESGCATPMA